MGLGTLVKQSSLYLIGNVASRAVGFLLVPLYAHYLSPAEYGLVDLIDLMIMVITLCVGVAAIGTAMVRIYHELPHEHDRMILSSTAFSLVIVLSLPISAVGILAAKPLSRLMFHSEANATIIAAFFVAMFFGNIGEIAATFVRLKDRVGLIVTYSLSTLVAAASFNIFFIAFQHRGIWGLVLSKLIVGTGGAIFLLLLNLRMTGLHFDLSYARRMFHFAAPLIASGLALFTLHFSDRFFLNAYGYQTQLGQYALGYRFAFMLPILIAEPFSRAWSVSFYRFAEDPGWQNVFNRVLRHLLFLMVLGALGLSLFSRPALLLMVTPAFRPALYVIPIVAFAYVFRQVGDFFRDLLLISRQSLLIGKLTVVTAALNIGLNFLWIPKYGMYGAAAATLASWFAYMVILWVAAYRQHHFPFPAFALGTTIGLSSLALVGAEFTTPATFWGSMATGSAWVLAFVLLLWMIGYFPQSDITDMVERVRMLRRTAVGWARGTAA
jgi:O-antigen/teichoic acid export membrane protein